MAAKNVSSVETALDFQFGWRWLLPAQNGQHISYVGLDAAELQWWQTAHEVVCQSGLGSGLAAESLFVALDPLNQTQVFAQLANSELGLVCVWGSGQAVQRLRSQLRGFGAVHEYALLPAGNPRVVVPLSSPRAAVAGLCLHRPGRWVAKVGMMVARILAYCGNYILLRGKVLLIATRVANTVPQGALQAGLDAALHGAHSDFALYLGTPDGNRKTVVLPVGDGTPALILKVAATPTARAALQNEASVLALLAGTPLTTRVPKLFGLKDAGVRLTLTQEYRQRQAVDTGVMQGAVLDFLTDLSVLGRDQIALANWLQPQVGDHALGLEKAGAKLRTRIEASATSGTQIWLHRNHGDFAPWNCSWTAQGLFVFDWEESRARRLALDDAFYYVLSPFVHVHKKPNAQKALVLALQFGGKLCSRMAATGAAADVRLYLALWLLGQLGDSDFYSELLGCLEQDWA